jgi:hypothetical protein
MTAATLEPLADAAVAARSGRDLFSFGMSGRIPDDRFAKNADGSITITGVELLKSGTFNGLSLIDADLDGMVERFAQLRDAGIFLPPFRLDHSWSILSVVGWFETLETIRRVDTTDSLEKAFLVGSIRLTGSIDYTPAQIVDAIKRGALTNRSSELGYYVTNSGVELPLVFYGCAYVDIPAVEGLAPVTLSRVHQSTPHKITNLTKGSPMDPKKLRRLHALRTKLGLSTGPDAANEAALSSDETTELDELEQEATAAGVTDSDVELAAATADDDEVVDDVPEGETDEERAAREAAAGEAPEAPEDPLEEGTARTDATVPGTPAAEPSDALRQAPADTDEVTRLRAQLATLRQEATERELATLRAAGVIVPANEEAATALLGHDDEDVRRMAGTLLANLPNTTVALGRRQGRTALSTSGNASGEAGSLIRLGMSKDEVGPLWAALSSEERAAHRVEYDAWRKDRDENGIRD